jgi:hypothetical protein
MVLEPSVVRPKQARYQAALRPDIKCTAHSKALSSDTAIPTFRICLNCATTMPNTFTGASLARIQRHFVGLAVHLFQGSSLHLQFHLRILFGGFGVTLSEELSNPLVGDPVRTESSCNYLAYRLTRGIDADPTPLASGS